MIYIVSGASRSGKTKVGKLLMKRLAISHIELDNFMMAFYLGMPETTIHPEDWPHVTAEKLEPFLNAFIKVAIQDDKDLVIEGEQLRPHNVRMLLDTYKNDVRACFLGFSDILKKDKIKNVKTFAEANDWLMTNTEEYIENHIENMIQYSKTIKKQCSENNIKYIDTSTDFSYKINEAIDYLTK